MVLLDHICKVDRDRCIGCGICVANCMTKAVQLRRKERTSLPPKSTGATYSNILAKKFGKWHMVKIGMKRLAGQRDAC
jgi:ferredoxin